MVMTIRVGFFIMGMCILSACSTNSTLTPEITQPVMDNEYLVTSDGTRLVVDIYQPTTLKSDEDDKEADYTSSDIKVLNAKAVIIALHGMNDYARTFEQAGPWWAEQNIIVYAYDQRGFGRSPNSGIWPGTDILSRDLNDMIMVVRARHQHLPIYIVGHSMGGAVAMVANGERELNVDGVILAAPAIWGGRRMPLFYRMTLSIASTFAPKKTLTGKGARRQATDNIPVLRTMQSDPYVLKATPLNSIQGIVDLMGRANKRAKQQKGNILFLYGDKDEIIPRKALNGVRTVIEKNDAVTLSVSTYEEGWHLLFRDIQAENVWFDIANWIDNNAR